MDHERAGKKITHWPLYERVKEAAWIQHSSSPTFAAWTKEGGKALEEACSVMKELRDALQKSPLQSREYIHLGLALNRAIDRACAPDRSPAEVSDKRQDKIVAGEPQLSREQIDDMNSGD